MQERAKQNRKALLFGCKSSPLEAKFPNEPEQNKSRSVEAVGNSITEDTPYTGSTRSTGTVVERISREKSQKERTTGDENETAAPTITVESTTENKSVSFREQEQHLTNGVDDKPEPVASDHEEDDKKIAENFRSLCGGKRPSLAAYLAGVPAPKATVEKPFLLSDGRVVLSASLDKAIYSHGEEIHVNVKIRNNSTKTVKRIKVKKKLFNINIIHY